MMPINPNAEPWVKQIKDASYWASLRAQMTNTTLPGRLNENEFLPYQVLEAIVDNETGGTFDPDIVNPNSGATGLGQLLQSGSEEVGWYESTFDRQLSVSDLKNPQINLRVSGFGLIGDWFQVNKKSWFDAAINYFGCQGRAGIGDGNQTCQQYYDNVRSYVEEWYGEDVAEKLEHGEAGYQLSSKTGSCTDKPFWEQPGCVLSTLLRGGKAIAENAADDVLAPIMQILPILGAIAIGGLVVFLAVMMAIR